MFNWSSFGYIQGFCWFKLQLYNNFCSLISSCRDPFQQFATDHLLYKFLKTEGYVDENIEEFTIDNVVQPVHRSGKLVNEEKNKGILMPIKFQIFLKETNYWSQF